MNLVREIQTSWFKTASKNILIEKDEWKCVCEREKKENKPNFPMNNLKQWNWFKISFFLLHSKNKLTLFYPSPFIISFSSVTASFQYPASYSAEVDEVINKHKKVRPKRLRGWKLLKEFLSQIQILKNPSKLLHQKYIFSSELLKSYAVLRRVIQPSRVPPSPLGSSHKSFVRFFATTTTVVVVERKEKQKSFNYFFGFEKLLFFLTEFGHEVFHFLANMIWVV